MLSKLLASALACFCLQNPQGHQYHFVTHMPGIEASKSLQFSSNNRYLVATRYVGVGNYTSQSRVIDLYTENNDKSDCDEETGRKLLENPPVETVSALAPIHYITDSEKYQHLFSLQGIVQEKTGKISSLEQILKNPELKSAAHSTDKSLLALGYVKEHPEKNKRQGKVVLYSNNPNDKRFTKFTEDL